MFFKSSYEKFNSIFEDISSGNLFKGDNEKTHAIMSYKKLKYRYIKSFKTIGVLNSLNKIRIYKEHEEIVINLTKKQVDDLLDEKNSKKIQPILLNPNNVQKILRKR